MPGHYHLEGMVVKPPRTFIAQSRPKVAPTAPSRGTGGRGGGRVDDKVMDQEAKKRPGFIWNSRTYSWDKDPNYKGGGATKEGFGLTKIKKKPKEDKGILMTSRASKSNLKIRKGQGKRKFRVKNPFVGGMGSSSNIGLS